MYTNTHSHTHTHTHRHAHTHIHTGTFPVVALMVGNAVTRLTSHIPECSGNSTLINPNETAADPCLLSECVTMRVEIAVTLSLMVGILMVGIAKAMVSGLEEFHCNPIVWT